MIIFIIIILFIITNNDIWVFLVLPFCVWTGWHGLTILIRVVLMFVNTVFAGVKAAVFLEEKISKSRGAAYATKE